MHIIISISETALEDNYQFFRVGKWYRLPFQYADVSLKRSDKKECSISHLGGSCYSVVARVDQAVNHIYNEEPGQLIILSLERHNLYLFADYWEMQDQRLTDFRPGDYVEGELELFLDCGLMRVLEYGLYEKIQETSRNGFYIVKIARILANSKEVASELDYVDGSVAGKYDSVYIECEAGLQTGNFVRDDLTLRTLDFYLDKNAPQPPAGKQ